MKTQRQIPWKLTLVLMLSISISLFLVACATASTVENNTSSAVTEPVNEPTATSETLPISEEDQLVAEAQAEGGEVMIYTSITIDDLEEVLAKFKETYPFTNPIYYRASGDDVIQKSMTESETGQHFADVFEIAAFEIYRLQQAGLLESFKAPQSEAYPAQAKDPAGYWTVDQLNTVVIGYNTDLVDPADIPTTWEELMDPKWKGSMGIEANDVELLAGMVNAWGEERAFALWEGIAAQEPSIVDGHTELAQLVSAGEFKISPTLYANRIEKLKAEGAPIDWVKSDPIVAYSQMVSLAAEAPHPATARLFINWLLSEAGQLAYQQVGRIPGRPGIESDPSSLTQGLNLVFTNPAWAEDYDYYAEKWKTLFNLP